MRGDGVGCKIVEQAICRRLEKKIVIVCNSSQWHGKLIEVEAKWTEQDH